MTEASSNYDFSGVPADQLDRAISEVASFIYVCKNCSEKFTLSEVEIRSYLTRGLHLPKRCGTCPSAHASAESTPDSLKGKFFSEPDSTRIPMVPWRHT